MQAKEFNYGQLIDDEYQSFMNQKLYSYDIQSQNVLSQKATKENYISISSNQTKRKGRPKGDKNARQRKASLVHNKQNIRQGHWNAQQNKRYHWFLQVYNKHFICKEMRRLDKIFKTMAVFIGSRQAQQCRSHHQKMEKKYHSFTSIILYLRSFHYKTQDFTIIQEDMFNNGVTQIRNLLTKKQLLDLQLIKEVQTIHTLNQQEKVDGFIEYQSKQFKFQQNFLDLLGEDYQYRFKFDHCFL